MRTLPCLLVLGACHRPTPPSDARADSGTGALLFRGATLLGVSEPGLQDGAPLDLLVEGGRIAAIAAAGTLEAEAEILELPGAWITPAFIDSHVHLAYLPDLAGLADGGVAGAVDLAAPEAFLAEDHAPLQLRASGPMVTAVGGYPTQSWGRDGYGLACADAGEASAAVARLATAGATVIKLPITDEPRLDDDALRAAVEAAHARGMPVLSHALDEEQASLAAELGVDLLAHTPTAALDEASASLWAGRGVVSTLDAFGGAERTVNNLALLRAAGAEVLYGTDFGNTRTAGIDPAELALLEAAGLDGAAILESGTRAPAERWGFEDLGALRVGARASLLVLSEDPRQRPAALAEPLSVYIDGVKR